MASKFALHMAAWKDCTACHLCRTRTRVVFARGSLPCDVLFVGEAPGESEDVLGLPFVGPAGKLLDGIIARAWEQAGSAATWAMTNAVGCIPRTDDGEKEHAPPEECVEACRPKLVEMVEIARPRLIVAVGKTAETAMDQRLKSSPRLSEGCEVKAIPHPAYLLRQNDAVRSAGVIQCVARIATALEDLHRS